MEAVPAKTVVSAAAGAGAETGAAAAAGGGTAAVQETDVRGQQVVGEIKRGRVLFPSLHSRRTIPRQDV